MSIFSKLIGRVNKTYTQILIFGSRLLYRKVYSDLLKRTLLSNKHIVFNRSAETEWLKKWGRFGRKPHLSSFRLFSQYIGDDVNIVPEEISASYIQPLLNPIEYRPYYQDKNTFERILPKEFLPKALLRSINGTLYDKEYTPVDFLSLNSDYINSITRNENRLFLKPSSDTSSGNGVLCFIRDSNGVLIESKNGEPLTPEFIFEYQINNPNFILQVGLSQHEYVNQFCPSSINTFRVCTYRSVVDNKVHVCQTIMRMGRKGQYVDNAHAGGVFIGVDRNGHLANYACDQNGNRYSSFNDIDFAKNSYVIPEFHKVLDLAKSAAEKIVHHRLIAHDICITADGTPVMVEFNIRGFSVWLFQFAIGPALGEYADEIIDYCVEHKHEVNKVYLSPF